MNGTGKPSMVVTKSWPNPDWLRRKLPASRPQNFILLYDSNLDSHQTFKKWKRKFSCRLALKGGEKLKTLQACENIAKKILEMPISLGRREVAIVAVGGGSVGDFAGFLSSILKRGIPLIHIPTTWLAALDSAHGGKTALNVGLYKNQLGTFYFPQLVCIVTPALTSQPFANGMMVQGEMIKMALLNRKLLSSIERRPLIDSWNSEGFIDFVVEGAKVKNKIVAQDPREENGIRYALNLGHTVGHVIETQKKIPHGEAVGYGLRFAVEWSHKKGFLKGKDFSVATEILETHGFRPRPKLLRQKLTIKQLSQDKKRVADDKVNFVFLSSIGKTKIQKVRVKHIVAELRRQGWIKN